MAAGACAASTRCCRRPCPAWRPRSSRCWPTTTPSSPTNAPAAAQSVGGQPARWLRALAAVPGRRRAAGGADGVEQRAAATTPCSTSALAIESALAARAPLTCASPSSAPASSASPAPTSSAPTATTSRYSSAVPASPRRPSFANAGLVAPGYVDALGRAGDADEGAAPPRSAAIAPVRLHARPSISAGPGSGGARAGSAPTTRTACACIGSRVFSRERLQQLTSALRHRLRASPGLPGAAAHAAGPRPGAARARRARRARHRATPYSTPTSCRKVEPGLGPANRAARRHPPARRRGRQLPPVRAAAAARGREARRSLSLRDHGPAHRAGGPAAPGPRCGRARPLAAPPTRAASRRPTTGPTPGRCRTRASPRRSMRSSCVRRSARRRCCARSACACRCRRCTATPSPRRCAVSDQAIDPAPRSALMDERYKVAISRLGNRDPRRRQRRDRRDARQDQPGRRRDALQGARRLVSGRAPTPARRRSGRAPDRCCPTVPPVLGASGVDGIWLNLGHGSSGWALACGSARAARRRGGRAAGADRRRRPRHRAALGVRISIAWNASTRALLPWPCFAARRRAASSPMPSAASRPRN